MIHVDKDACAVSGSMVDVLTHLSIVMTNMAESLARAGGNKEDFRAILHGVVDTAMNTTVSGTTIDLSFQREG